MEEALVGAYSQSPLEEPGEVRRNEVKRMSEYETHDADDSERLDEPIKVRWTGYARARITEYNSQYDISDDDSLISPGAFLEACTRQKTQIVVASLKEANAVYYELLSYSSGQRVWMNSSMDRALSRVRDAIEEEMEELGYEARWESTDAPGGPKFEGFERQ